MKVKLCLLIVAMAMLFASCGKDPQPDLITSFSVLGDSFSAFEGYVDPDTNDPWSAYPKIGVTQPEQMWWHQVAVETGWVLEKNNSFSGTLVCNYDPNNYYGAHSYLRRMNALGNPDVIFVFGATNDIYNRVPLGEYAYSLWTDEELCTFRPAMACLLDGLKRLYPSAKIYVMVDMELCIDDPDIDDETREAYIESMHRIANRYHVTCIDIYGIQKDWWHPNAQGQAGIAREVLEAVLSDFNV